MTRDDLLLLLAAYCALLGWALPWPDPARAGYVLQWLGWCALCWVLMRGARRPRWWLLASSMAGGLLAAGCGAWWGVLSQVDGVCDEATGRPVTAALAAIWLAVLGLWTTIGGRHAGED